MGRAESRRDGLGSEQGIPQVGDRLSVGANRVPRSDVGDSRLHRGCRARFPSRSDAEATATLQTMDTDKFKMGWLVVAFDLPVMTREQRKGATDFRMFLLDDGYQMIQYSVYARACVSFARQQTHLSRVKQNL